MNPFQVLGVIACCVSLFVGVLMFLSWQGVSLPVAFLGVYAVAIASMLGMQRRARESCEGLEQRRHRPHREASVRVARAEEGVMDEEIVGAHEPFRA